MKTVLNITMIVTYTNTLSMKEMIYRSRDLIQVFMKLSIFNNRYPPVCSFILSNAHFDLLDRLDSYLENQRRRAVRESQGYYFPYKKYTLKDYKDLQKTESQFNPYGSYKAENIDRVCILIHSLLFILFICSIGL